MSSLHAVISIGLTLPFKCKKVSNLSKNFGFVETVKALCAVIIYRKKTSQKVKTDTKFGQCAQYL